METLHLVVLIGVVIFSPNPSVDAVVLTAITSRVNRPTSWCHRREKITVYHDVNRGEARGGEAAAAAETCTRVSILPTAIQIA